MVSCARCRYYNKEERTCKKKGFTDIDPDQYCPDGRLVNEPRRRG